LHADFELGGWTVRPGRLILEREGEIAHVKPKTLDVLVCLADRPGAVVSREELLSRVWQNVYVTDDVITQAIAELRRAVHDDRRQPTFLETVPRRGYRLLQPVRFPGREFEPSRAAAADTVPRSSVARRRFRLEALLAPAAMAFVFLGWVAVREGSIIRSELQLLRAARHPPGDPRPTQDTDAYEHYLKARQKFRPYSPEPDQMVEALSLATRAVERDPQFAQAHALIAEIETFRGFWNRGYQLTVQLFPDPGRQTRVSTERAFRAWWTPDGRQLLFLDDRLEHLWRADVEPGRRCASARQGRSQRFLPTSSG
jgi:DNA-binding winged helix-turn-helix (wHTH) protein